MTVTHDPEQLQQAARDHLWMHFTRHASYDPNQGAAELPVIVRGEGAYVYDVHGKRYLDGLAGLFVSQLGHGREDLADAAARQARELAYWPIWSTAHPTAIELAERLARYAPGDLDRVFFTSGGSESVEAAWKLAKQYFKVTGRPGKHKVISRAIAYHGTTHGALSITGLPGLKAPFEPLVPSTIRVPNTNIFHAPIHRDDPEAFGRWAADQIAVAIENEGPDTVAAVFVEPVQNSGGCFPPPPGYFERVREICDQYDVLLVSDEVICAFGRLGYMFGSERYGYQPDIITCAKGLTSGYAPMGAVIASNAIMEPFLAGGHTFAHGTTFAGHPVAAAIALANLDAFEREGINEHVRETEGDFRAALERLRDLAIVADVRGAGFFFGIELDRDKIPAAPDGTKITGSAIAQALYENGLYCRVDQRSEPVIELAPPLICDQSHFDEFERIIRRVLEDASK